MEVSERIVNMSVGNSDIETVSYSIVDGNINETFAIDAEGQITLAKSLDYATTSHYTLTAQVVNETGRTDTVSVSIDVTSLPSSGGCSLRAGSTFDPLFPLMLVLAGVYGIRKYVALK